ncbi:hypothetical protein GLOIN_2v1767412 [Rhizophagus irregularis DAOM 181602=DAOM 197198]|nr:hypothetical protein GLOIN_2v1767412 [Rhizophagus irregularis DAOM 181602=DAOM 197198]
MEFPKYNGNIHPDEWIKDIQKFYYIWKTTYKEFLRIAISLVDPTIKLPTEIRDTDELCNALKEDISFTIFKNTNKRILQTLKYIPERKDIIVDEENLITNNSVVALKHVATGKYLSSIKNLCYETESKSQLVFVGSSEPDPDSLWKVLHDEELLATHNKTSINLQHFKSNMLLATSISYDSWTCRYSYHKSPSTKHTEVNCSGNQPNWNFKLSKLENHQGYLKSNDIIKLSTKKLYDNNGQYTLNGQVEFLRSHDIQFTIGNDAFQEVICHNERLGGNDEWCIELIKQA